MRIGPHKQKIPSPIRNLAHCLDLVARNDQELINPDSTFDGPVSLKDLTRQATRELERKIILKALQANGWNRTKAARALSISYRSLLYKIKEAGV